MGRYMLWFAVAASVYGRAILGCNLVRVPLVLGMALVMALGVLARTNPALAGH